MTAGGLENAKAHPLAHPQDTGTLPDARSPAAGNGGYTPGDAKSGTKLLEAGATLVAGTSGSATAMRAVPQVKAHDTEEETPAETPQVVSPAEAAAELDNTLPETESLPLRSGSDVHEVADGDGTADEKVASVLAAEDSAGDGVEDGAAEDGAAEDGAAADGAAADVAAEDGATEDIVDDGVADDSAAADSPSTAAARLDAEALADEVPATEMESEDSPVRAASPPVPQAFDEQKSEAAEGLESRSDDATASPENVPRSTEASFFDSDDFVLDASVPLLQAAQASRSAAGSSASAGDGAAEEEPTTADVAASGVDQASVTERHSTEEPAEAAGTSAMSATASPWDTPPRASAPADAEVRALSEEHAAAPTPEDAEVHPPARERLSASHDGAAATEQVEVHQVAVTAVSATAADLTATVDLAKHRDAILSANGLASNGTVDLSTIGPLPAAVHAVEATVDLAKTASPDATIDLAELGTELESAVGDVDGTVDVHVATSASMGAVAAAAADAVVATGTPVAELEGKRPQGLNALPGAVSSAATAVLSGVFDSLGGAFTMLTGFDPAIRVRLLPPIMRECLSGHEPRR